MPLPHQPAAGGAGQRVGEQIADVGRHHVQRAAGVAFGCWLEIALREGAPVQVDLAGVGHMGDLTHGGVAQPVRRLEQLDRLIALAGALGGQGFKQRIDALAGQKVMLDDAEALAPVVQCVGHAGLRQAGE